MNLDDLEFEITSLAAQINAATSRWLDLLAEFDLRGGYEKWECTSTAQWLNWRCGIDIGAAREKVRAALVLRELPKTHEAFAEGRLSFSKVRAMTRVANAETESELLELALISTASQLEKIVRSIRRADVGEGAVEPERYCNWYTDYDGSVVFKAKLPADEAAVVIAALKKGHDVSAETFQPHSVNQADAFVAMAVTSLANEPKETDERYQVVVHVEASDSSAKTEDGFHLSAETARRLSCDAAVVTQIENPEGEALSVGRKTRAIPTALRRAMRSRDSGCRFPGCNSTRFVDRHHIKHWSQGGETKLSNLVTLCRRHHRFCHDNRVFIKQEGKQFAFETRDGQRLHEMYSTRGNARSVYDQKLDVSAEMLAGTGEKLTNYGLGVITQYFAHDVVGNSALVELVAV